MMDWASSDAQHFITSPLELILHTPNCDAEALLGKMLRNEIEMRRKFAGQERSLETASQGGQSRALNGYPVLCSSIKCRILIDGSRRHTYAPMLIYSAWTI